jgi:hypothetical protein
MRKRKIKPWLHDPASKRTHYLLKKTLINISFTSTHHFFAYEAPPGIFFDNERQKAKNSCGEKVNF